MYWYSPVIAALIIFIFFVIACVCLYKKHYEQDLFNLNFVQTHSAINRSNILVYKNFSNIYCNLVLKVIIFIIFSLVIHFTDRLWITYIYMALTFFSWLIFNGKKKEFKSMSEHVQPAFKPALTASSFIPVFQTITYFLLFAVYYFK